METNFVEIFLETLNYLLMFGILLTIVMIMKYGIDLINSRGNPSAFGETKKGIKNTLIGLGVLLLSYVLLGTINPDLTKINLSFEGIDVSSINFIKEQKPESDLKSYVFEEIPIGTILENLLAGTSSLDIPCYEYDDSGNTVDQNKDGKIDNKDILLGVDTLYCMENLLEAYHKKIENTLVPLIGELYELTTSCTCTNCYTGYFKEDVYKNNFGMHGEYGNPIYETLSCSYSCNCYDDCTEYCSTNEDGDEECSESCTTYCETCTVSDDCDTAFSHCDRCCGGKDGCSSAPSNPFYAFEQYQYDPCYNRKEIKCKEQEIEQFMTGVTPKESCNISALSPLVLTFSVATERLDAFKSFYENNLNDLSTAKTKMKYPWGERITLAEFNKIENETNNYKIEKESFSNYDISKYCRNFNYNDNNTTCKIIDGEEQYSYDGDAATFYFNKEYDDYFKQSFLSSSASSQCSIIDGEVEKGSYSGVVPIGEAVEFAEDWANEVTTRISNVQIAGNDIRREIVENLYNFSATCECGKCQSGNRGKYYSSTSVSCDEGGLYCPFYSFFECSSCVPLNDSVGVCSNQDFRNVVKNLFGQNYEMDTVCFIGTDDETEKKLREDNINLMSYFQKSKAYSSMKDIGGFRIVLEDNSQTITDLFETIEYPEELLENNQKCNNDLNSDKEDRFEVLEKLTISRKKLTGCVSGYNNPYKENPSEQTEVFSCLEGIEEKEFIILPGFPYPFRVGYVNCFPYNSNLLTDQEKEICYYSPLGEGSENNLGCLKITENMMDNYYCCE